MTVRDFALPDLGEGLTESEIVSWRVAVGDLVELNQIIAEVETAKALVELPSPFAGVVAKLYEEPGATVQVGSPIVAFEVDDGAAAAEPEGDVPTTPQPAERNSVLVGYGPKVEGGASPKRKGRKASTHSPVLEATPVVAPEATPVAAADPAPVVELAERRKSTPPVRKLAADLGIDLATIEGTGKGGLVTREDVLAASSGAPVSTAADEATDVPRETRTPIKGVRKHTAAAMVASAFTAPHVTEFLTIDVTPTVDLLDSLKRRFPNHKLGILTIVAKALCIAASRNPSVNSRWDESANEIVQFGYVNLGIAAATPRGLVVPNIKDAERMSLLELADALTELTATARAGTTTPAALSSGTISITNIGVFGIDAGTPILNPGEAAILAMGAIRRQPWEHRGEIALRSVMTLSLSFDHRLVDGEQGSRFLADIGSILAEPGIVLTMV
jgi:pyruvate dehydrogenase E2 component (dihydrolipoamide acetyltransferase)